MIGPKQLNDLINIRQSNFVYASFVLIRNGIILFGFFFLTMIAISLYTNKDNSDKSGENFNTQLNQDLNISPIDTISFKLNDNIENLEN